MSRTHHRGYRRIVDEAREHWVPPSSAPDDDWSDLEQRIRAGSPAPIVPLRTAGHKLTIASGLVLAAAAAATLVLRAPPPATSVATAELAASVSGGEGLRIVGPSGEVRVASAIRVGDRVETSSTDVGFVSLSDTGARAVAWRIERDSRLSVSSARVPLGLSLEQGAVEADVARVASGEAFVVDVGPLRVAVRGTHLRVARTGSRATVDLTEGTIAIGPIPEAGLTEGTLVSAPAHVELDLAQPTQVRVVLEQDRIRAAAFTSEARAPSAPAKAVAPHAPLPHPHAALPPLPTAAPLPAPASADTPTEAVARAVRACVDKHVPLTQVHVTVTTTLVIDVGEGGRVQLARFEPPLAPEVQSCAADTIYKTRFLTAGTERITIVAER